MTLQVLARINKRTTSSAGPRYTPGIEAGAPNVQIVDLLAAVDGLTVNAAFRKQVEDLAADLSKRWERSKGVLKQREAVERLVSQLASYLNDLRTSLPGSPANLVSHIKRTAKKAEQHSNKQDELLEEEARKRREEIRAAHAGNEKQFYTAERSDDILNSINDNRRQVTQLEIILRECVSFCDSPACALRFKNVGVLTGSWGTGKTHFLCDIANRFISSRQPALVMLARDFEPGKHGGDSLAMASGFANSFGELLDKLDALGREYGQRALLLIDGLNESDIKAWRRDVGAMTDAVERYQYVGVIFSCREPFEKAIFPSKLYARIPKLRHVGFDDIQFDAQRVFFDYYDIPLPEVPLMAEEFSRPLTLKILCLAFCKLPKKEKEKGFYGLSSGQKGMTFILEQFVIERAKEIEAVLALPPRFCWTLLKGDRGISDPELSGLATYMAHHIQEWVPYDHVIRLLKSRNAIRTVARAKKLLRLLVKEGIVYHHMTWREESEGGPIEVVGLPYQRFTDHIVARHLLDKYLDRSSRQAVRRSFHMASHLGRIFRIKDRYFRQYEIENWAEAIIVEFPEFVKKILPAEERELYFYLPKSAQDVSAYFKPFVGGLVWRAPTSISRQTDRIVGTYFWSSHKPWRREMAEALISVATKPKHPYSGLRFYRNLAQVPMNRRDLLWSEFLRTSHYSGTAVERIVAFYEQSLLKTLASDTAANAIAVLSTFLTTTDRFLRDRATKGLMRIGEKHPKALFDFAKKAITFNDPYLIERLMAATFGMAMRRFSVADSKFRSELLTFARWVVSEFFLPRGRARTQHTLIRGYAYGLVELAKFLDPRFVRKSWVEYVSPPFKAIPDPFPNPGTISKRAVDKKVNGAMHMDFANYTLGRLIPNRNNYDMKHRVYRKVRKQIEWKMVNLGYDQALFKALDSMIGQENWREREDGRKVDRYGKKYSWIAYFEMYGVREARGSLPDWRIGERSSDCDIDPSFPEYVSKWSPHLRDIFSGSSSNVIEWLGAGPIPNYDNILVVDEIDGVKGPWIALDGYVQQTQPDDRREIFTFIRGLLINELDVVRFAEKFREVEYPGNLAIPDPGEDHYTYAGEIPWSYRFATGTRANTGKRLRQLRTTFDRSESRSVRKRVKRFWRELYQLLPENDIQGFSLHNLVSQNKDDPKWKLINEAIERANSLVPKGERVRSAFELWGPPTAEEAALGSRFVSEYVRLPGIQVELPVWGFGWESYHSAVNNFSGFDSPAPALCEELGLLKVGHTSDFIDRNRQTAAMYRRWTDPGASLSSHAMYLRRDLLLRYLKKTGQVLVLAIWGEREFHYGVSEAFRDLPEVRKIWTNHDHIHRQLRTYGESNLSSI